MHPDVVTRDIEGVTSTGSDALNDEVVHFALIDPIQDKVIAWRVHEGEAVDAEVARVLEPR